MAHSAIYNLPPEKIERYRRKFNAIDLNKDGVITLREMASIGKVLGYRLSMDELGEIFGARDLDSSGGITFDEFVIAMEERARTNALMQPLRDQFRRYDIHRRGYITSDEAFPILSRELGFDMNKTESFVDLFDKNRNYRLSMQEFQPFQSKISELKEQILKAFREFDQNSDGYVDYNEARSMMSPKGFSDNEIYTLFIKHDKDGDGRLNYTEFAHFWDIPIF